MSVINKTFSGKSLFIACSAVAVVSACSQLHTPFKVSSAAPSSAINADAVIVSVEEVRHIANFAGLLSYENEDLNHPSPGSVNAPGPCRAAGNSDLTFATGFKQFRAVVYSGTTDDLRPGGVAPVNTVSQAVAVYPDADAARGALDRLESTLTQCASLHDSAYDFALGKPDPTTLKLGSAGWSHQYRVKSAALLSVGVSGIEPTEQIANTVLQTITDRIK